MSDEEVPAAAEGAAQPGQTGLERLRATQEVVARAKASEAVQAGGLVPIALGGKGFVALLDRQTALIEETLTKLHRLRNAGAGYHLQIEELLETKREIADLKSEALAIRRMVTGSDSRLLGADFVARTWRERIDPLALREASRQARAGRLQGPMVMSRRELGRNCNGMIGEALLLATRFIRDVAVDPYGGGISGLWRWMTLDEGRPSIWLYRHDPEHRWLCLFFRIEITRAVQDLYFGIESYVPFGIDDDPAQYRLDASKAYNRPQWREIDVFTGSYNRANTFSMNYSETRTTGVSFGSSHGTSYSRQESNTQTQTQNQSRTTGTNISEAYSWFRSQGTSFGGSMHGSSYGSNSGEGGSFARTLGSNDSFTTGQGDSSSQTTGVAEGTNSSVQRSVTESRAATVGSGFQLTDGRTLQIEKYNVGIDYSLPAGQHLDQWRMANHDAGRIYDSVIATFESMCEHVVNRLESAGFGTGELHGQEIAPYMEEIGELILIEPPFDSVLPALPRPPDNC